MENNTIRKLKDLANLFLKLGFVAFGGPAAHIAMLEDEVVEKRKWMTRDHFLDLIGATNLIPGPNSTEMTMHVGYQYAGVAGLFMAGICFIGPAVLLTGILAYLYIEYGELPGIAPFLLGIKPAVLAIIAGAIYKLGKKALKSWQLGLIGVIVVIANFCGINEVTCILGGGVFGMLWANTLEGKSLRSYAPILLFWFTGAGMKLTTTNLFLVFLKVGSVLFGSGYVLVAYLDGELVEKLGWLSKSELLDAIAIGQFTPGPVLSTATFVGYQIQGVQGAMAATLGIFLPSFIFVWILNPLIPKLRSSKITAAFLDAVNVAAVAVMLVVTLMLAKEVLLDWKSLIIASISFYIYFFQKKVSVVYLVLCGAILGWVLSFINF
ncbi:MAG: chromate efflux transporter [Saprospiraceae bacterium]|nr:chromate efflux transporter [Saprospiraceae bacterium]